MAHCLTDAGSTGRIVVFGGAKAIRRFKTFDLHLSLGFRLVCPFMDD